MTSRVPAPVGLPDADRSLNDVAMDQPLTRPDGSEPRILVVDDERNLAELLAMAFSYQRWDPVIAVTAHEARDAARSRRFDAAVLDIMLPDGDGVELMTRMRAIYVLALFARNPRIVLSKATILDRVWGYDFGANGNIVELHVSYLRRKIDAPFPDLPPLLHTNRGAGYMIRP